MKLLLVVTSVVALFAASAYAEEAGPTWEVSGGAAASLSQTWVNATSTTSSTSDRSITLTGEADYFVMPQVEVGLSVSALDFISGGHASSQIILLAGPTYNFSTDIDNSIYATAKAGITLSYNGASISNTTAFTWLVGAGKRFQLVSHVSYMPEVLLVNTSSTTITSSDGGTSLTNPTTRQLEIVPLQFAFTF
jgi:opacity protein-like surface antigen